VAKESALLKCESCKNVQRVWLNKCKACRDPEDNWYEDRIAELEAKVESQDKQIRALVDKLHSRENNG
jgi:hypothetical protein